jgi:hypothetical protein
MLRFEESHPYSGRKTLYIEECRLRRTEEMLLVLKSFGGIYPIRNNKALFLLGWCQASALPNSSHCASVRRRSIAPYWPCEEAPHDGRAA